MMHPALIPSMPSVLKDKLSVSKQFQFKEAGWLTTRPIYQIKLKNIYIYIYVLNIPLQIKKTKMKENKTKNEQEKKCREDPRKFI